MLSPGSLVEARGIYPTIAREFVVRLPRGSRYILNVDSQGLVTSRRLLENANIPLKILRERLEARDADYSVHSDECGPKDSCRNVLLLYELREDAVWSKNDITLYPDGCVRYEEQRIIGVHLCPVLRARYVGEFRNGSAEGLGMILLGPNGVVYEGPFEQDEIKTGVPALIHLVEKKAIDNTEIKDNYGDNIKILKEAIRETYSIREYSHKNSVPLLVFDDGDSYQAYLGGNNGKYIFNGSSVVVKTTLRDALEDGRRNIKKLMPETIEPVRRKGMDFRSIVLEEMRSM
jgi:hypothetical protein